MFKNFFKKKTDIYIHGTIETDCLFTGITEARKNTLTGEVQFVLWKAGEQGHEKDYWHNYDKSWWQCFEPTL